MVSKEYLVFFRMRFIESNIPHFPKVDANVNVLFNLQEMEWKMPLRSQKRFLRSLCTNTHLDFFQEVATQMKLALESPNIFA